MVAKQEVAGEVASLKEAIDRGYTFCLLQAISSSVYLRYPNLNSVEVKNANEVLAGLEANTCQAGFVTIDEWRKKMNSHCERLLLLDSAVYSIANGYPVRDDLQAPVSWAITRALSAGAYETIRREAQTDHLPAIDESCVESTTAGPTRTGQLDLQVTGAPMLLSAITCSVALLWFCYTELRRSRSLSKSNEELILETPSLADRTCNLRAAEKRRVTHAEHKSPACENQDLRLIARLIRSRNLTRIRVDAASNLRTDGPLTLNDVPMLLSIMGDMFGPAQQDFQESGRRDSSRFSTYLRRSLNSFDEIDDNNGAGDQEEVHRSPKETWKDVPVRV